VRHAIGVSSGTDALLVALMALGIGPGDEVVTTTYSFFATAGASRASVRGRCWWTSSPDTFNIDVRGVDARSPTGRRRSCRCTCTAVRRHGAAAGARGTRRHSGHRGRRPGHRRNSTSNRRLAHSATIGCFSFFPSKNLGAFGDAGLVTTERRRSGRTACGCCARTAPSASTITAWSAELPPRRAAGGRARVKAPHLGRLDGRAPAQRRAVPRALRRTASSIASSPRSNRRTASTSTTSSSSACPNAIA
jgi:hypothetical protein